MTSQSQVRVPPGIVFNDAPGRGTAALPLASTAIAPEVNTRLPFEQSGVFGGIGRLYRLKVTVPPVPPAWKPLTFAKSRITTFCPVSVVVGALATTECSVVSL